MEMEAKIKKFPCLWVGSFFGSGITNLIKETGFFAESLGDKVRAK
jgi:hypothetical protein